MASLRCSGLEQLFVSALACQLLLITTSFATNTARANACLSLIRSLQCRNANETEDCVRLAAENWAKFGNIFGPNDIAEIMFHRDVMVLGLSDGFMCAATGFGLIMQKFVCRGLFNWNREGWIIQSVSTRLEAIHKVLTYW